MEDFADDLTEYLVSRAGDSLRVVVHYGGDDYEFFYLRDDLDGAKLRRRADEVHANITAGGTARDSNVHADLGGVEATLQMRERAVILHFPMEEGRGVIVSLESDAARDLKLFVRECLRLL